MFSRKSCFHIIRAFDIFNDFQGLGEICGGAWWEAGDCGVGLFCSYRGEELTLNTPDYIHPNYPEGICVATREEFLLFTTITPDFDIQ